MVLNDSGWKETVIYWHYAFSTSEENTQSYYVTFQKLQTGDLEVSFNQVAMKSIADVLFLCISELFASISSVEVPTCSCLQAALSPHSWIIHQEI